MNRGPRVITLNHAWEYDRLALNHYRNTCFEQREGINTSYPSYNDGVLSHYVVSHTRPTPSELELAGCYWRALLLPAYISSEWHAHCYIIYSMGCFDEVDI